MDNAKILYETVKNLGYTIFSGGTDGWFNDLMLAGTLAGVEMGLKKSKIPYKPGGLMTAIEHLSN